jgi:hypothetical protein
MTATPDIIPSDLTLEIGEDLSPERFMAAARAFFGYVQEIGDMLSPEGKGPSWTVHVREGSTLLGIDPAADAAPEIIQAIYSRAEEGIHHLSIGEIDSSGLSEPAMRHLRTLSELAEGRRRRPHPVRLWVRCKPGDVDANIAQVISEDWRVDYDDFGTIEGRLDTIQDKSGSLQLQIRDAMLRQTVRCYFPEAMLSDAFDKFRKRVEVSGVIYYRKNGTPVSIEAVRLDKLPEDDELPSPEDVRGILRIGA